MSELYAPHEGVKTCPVCKMDVVDLQNAQKYIDPKNQEIFFFDTGDCYKQFIENPEQFSFVEEDNEDES